MGSVETCAGNTTCPCFRPACFARPDFHFIAFLFPCTIPSSFCHSTFKLLRPLTGVSFVQDHGELWSCCVPVANVPL
eukprot:4172507-Pyramimonas_sp.AAC.1